MADGYCMTIKNFCIVYDSEPRDLCYLTLVVTVFAKVLSVMADNVFVGYCRQGSPHNCYVQQVIEGLIPVPCKQKTINFELNTVDNR